MNGYPIATEAFDLEIYILATLFAGSQALADIEHDHQGLRWARTTFESSEVSRRLISLAVMLRSFIDRSGCEADITVGVLTPDISEPSHRETLCASFSNLRG